MTEVPRWERQLLLMEHFQRTDLSDADRGSAEAELHRGEEHAAAVLDRITVLRRGAGDEPPTPADWQVQEIRRLLAALEALGVKADVVLPDGTHLYWCTAHRCTGSPVHCESETRLDGDPKTPACCKWCQTPCRHRDMEGTPT